MLTPSDFVFRWNEFLAAHPSLAEGDEFELLTAQTEDLQDKNIPALDKQSLLEAGLPRSAAPNIEFIEINRGLRRIWEVHSP